MAQAIVTVLILLIFIVYAVFFSLWNAGTVSVTGYYLSQDISGGAPVPLFLLPLAGLLVGAIIMAIALSAPWASLKSKLIAAEDRLQAEQLRCKDRGRKIEALKNRVVKLQTQLEQLSPATETGERSEVTDLGLPEGDEGDEG